MIHDDEIFRKGVVSRPFSLSSKGDDSWIWGKMVAEFHRFKVLGLTSRNGEYLL